MPTIAHARQRGAWKTPALGRVAWCLVWVVLISGCIRNVESYPSTWPALLANGCSAVVGTYENLGEGPDGRRGEPLFELLVAVYDHEKSRRNGDDAPGPVTLSTPEPGVLEAHTQRLSQRFLAGNREFACVDGALEFARTGVTGGNVGGWFGSSVVRAARDEDGRLVVSRDERGFGLLGFVVPVFMSFQTWSRFKPATQARAPEHVPLAAEMTPRPDIVEILALTLPTARQLPGDFSAFEMTATVHYVLRSSDVAVLLVSPVLYRSTECVLENEVVFIAGEPRPVARGENTVLIPIRWFVGSSGPGAQVPGVGAVTVDSSLYSAAPDNRSRPAGLIRSFGRRRDLCSAVPARDARQSRPGG